MVKQNIHCQAHVICINTVYALCAVLPCEKKTEMCCSLGSRRRSFFCIDSTIGTGSRFAMRLRTK